MQRRNPPLPRSAGVGWRFADIPDGDGRRTETIPVPARNGLPARRYVWRGRRYPLAERALRLAEAEHGVPE